MNERAGAPAWILMAAGVVNLVYSVVYAVWTWLLYTSDAADEL